MVRVDDRVGGIRPSVKSRLIESSMPKDTRLASREKRFRKGCSRTGSTGTDPVSGGLWDRKGGFGEPRVWTTRHRVQVQAPSFSYGVPDIQTI